MVTYSHSRLSTFEKCQIKYKYKYIDKLQPDYKQSIEGFLGNKVHETLEWVYHNANNRTFELDDLIKYYIESWTNDLNPEIKIIKKEFSSEHYFNKGIKFLINYFLKHSPFKDNTIETEKRINLNLDINGKYKIIGFIDRLVHNKETNTCEIHDYKTGSMPSQNELDNDRQLALYSIAIRNTFADVKDVHLIWHFLDHNEKKISKRTIEQLEQLKNKIIKIIDEIESTTDFKPIPSALCNWCEFRSYCPIIKENPDYPDKPIQIKQKTISKETINIENNNHTNDNNKNIFEF